jgi:hypothetical protein
MAALALGAVFAHAHGPARIAGHCTPPHYPGSGYFSGLRVEHTTCSVGRRVTTAWYRCRIRNGKAGTCHARRVAGFACHEHRNQIPTELDATVTCHKGRAKVVTSYQQNL